MVTGNKMTERKTKFNEMYQTIIIIIIIIIIMP